MQSLIQNPLQQAHMSCILCPLQQREYWNFITKHCWQVLLQRLVCVYIYILLLFTYIENVTFVICFAAITDSAYESLNIVELKNTLQVQDIVPISYSSVMEQFSPLSQLRMEKLISEYGRRSNATKYDATISTPPVVVANSSKMAQQPVNNTNNNITFFIASSGNKNVDHVVQYVNGNCGTVHCISSDSQASSYETLAYVVYCPTARVMEFADELVLETLQAKSSMINDDLLTMYIEHFYLVPVLLGADDSAYEIDAELIESKIANTKVLVTIVSPGGELSKLSKKRMVTSFAPSKTTTTTTTTVQQQHSATAGQNKQQSPCVIS